ncbi:conserved hypothetical protein [Paecilomyces variotii No. 5]|uniref:SET domain-containing protein n=1 Tax=Byssochlamys spectabilis (strain No. 5 / NBRC 109023) TaxID=1356009 RepID=V5HU29_BYSSN|nr:conserved hypothetical protein [Paecilomyces variotii No. 5]
MSHARSPPEADKSAQWEKPFAKVFISEEKGMGLKATSDIPAGTMLINEEVIAVLGEERLKSVTNPREYNQFIAAKVKAMGGNEYARQFMSLPNKCKEHYDGFMNIFGGVMETCNFPANLDGIPSAVVGLDSAYLNHACFPNVVVSFLTPQDIYGERAGQHPDEYWIRAYTCVNVAKGEELAAAYNHLNFPAATRKARMQGFYAFDCHCEHCEKADPAVDGFMDVYGKIERTLIQPHAIENEPAAVLEAAYDLGIGMIAVGIFDYRYATLWEQCAVLCAWHSDEGRALVFAGRSHATYELLEGADGRNSKRLWYWRNNIQELPGFGASKRGKSSEMEAKLLVYNPRRHAEILFMLGAKKKEYVRLSDYSGVIGQREDESFGWITREHDNEDDDDEKETPQQLEAFLEELENEKKEYDQDRLAKEKEKPSANKKSKGKGKGKKAKH